MRQDDDILIYLWLLGSADIYGNLCLKSLVQTCSYTGNCVEFLHVLRLEKLNLMHCYPALFIEPVAIFRWISH